MGRIIATVCAIYGWTHRYVLLELSWPQILLFHDNGIEYDFARHGMPLKKDPEVSDDVPDVDRIESELGFLIRR